MADQHHPLALTGVTADAREHLQLVGPLIGSWAPGRVNLIGEHTDYNDGWVLPITIARHMACVGQLNGDPTDGTVRLYSGHYRETVTFSVHNPPTADDPQGYPVWARFIAGALCELQEMGIPLQGFAAAIDGDIPIGSGMSSSAALLVATLMWLSHALTFTLAPLDLARIAQRAETRGSGVRVGILDQAASILGRPGHATLLDCASLTYSYVPFEFANMRCFLCDTGVERSLVTSKYNERRSECELSVQALSSAFAQEGDPRSVGSLRDVGARDLVRLGGHIPEPARSRARHVVTENHRTLLAADAMRCGDALAFGALILESHASLRDDYAVSCPELDAMVEIATRLPGALGARLVGAGFGGSVLLITTTEAAAGIIATLTSEYPQRTGRSPTIFEVVPNGGPGTTIIPVT